MLVTKWPSLGITGYIDISDGCWWQLWDDGDNILKRSPLFVINIRRQHRIFVHQKTFWKLSLAKVSPAWARTNPKSFIFRYLQKNLLFVQSLFWKIWFFLRFGFIIKTNFGESRDKNTLILSMFIFSKKLTKNENSKESQQDGNKKFIHNHNKSWTAKCSKYEAPFMEADLAV